MEEPVIVERPIYIRADGGVEGTDRIQRNGNLYTLTCSIIVNDSRSHIPSGIIVQRDDVIIDGAGFSIQAKGFVDIGVDLAGRRNVTIKNLQIIGFNIGINLWDSSGNRIISNNISESSYGLWIWNSTYNQISGNRITANKDYGVIVSFSSNNNILSNLIEENDCGIYFEHSSNNMLRGNVLKENNKNIYIAFESLSDCIHDIDFSNMVEGKPVYYWVNRENMVVPSDAGYVALINCTSMLVQNVKVSNNGQGILLAYTKDSTVANNVVENNMYGILVWYSQNINITKNRVGFARLEGPEAFLPEGIRIICSKNVSITKNYISKTGNGIFLSGSTQVLISSNNITSNANKGIECIYSNHSRICCNYVWNNTFAGINLVNSYENHIIGNTLIENNGWGIRLSGAVNNTFYHNSFINNKVEEGLQVSNLWYWGRPEPNVWDNGRQGNYWSDYKSRYPNATEINNSGIGNTPYYINEVNIDRYPLIRPFKTPH
ncbi:MAG: NosD domain-containing protein [Candidatus Bathyarchaeia archaeon]